ncbi:MAG: putative RNA-dependent RNA polymerase [Trichoderma harzianum mononegavirus 1]|nr:MAG: putative RNA-dependent RNA polymerase [Trichoderma harzianum mononegavirus 1]
MVNYRPLYSSRTSSRDDEDPWSEEVGSDKRFFPDTYLDSPILIGHQTEFMTSMILPVRDRGKSEMDKFSKFVKDRTPDWETIQLVHPREYPHIYNYDWPDTLADEAKSALEVADIVWSQVKLAVKEWSGLTIDGNPELADHYESMVWFRRWSFFDSLILAYEKQCAGNGMKFVDIRLGDHTRCLFSRNMIVMRTHAWDKAFTYNQFLMIKDVLYSRANVQFAREILYPSDLLLKQLVSETMDWHERCLYRYDNAGFEILKQTEALSKAYLSQITDSIFSDDGPFPRMIEKIRKKEAVLPEFDPDDCLVDIFVKVLNKTRNTQHVTELFGLLKISGHPLIDPRAGGRSAAAAARTPDMTRLPDAYRVVNEFKRCMLESHVAQKGWPKLVFPKRAQGTKLHQLYKKQVRSFNRSSYPLDDWTYVSWGKICDFDFSPNYLDLIDDKSISFYKSNIRAEWDNDIPPTSERRLLLELVKRKQFDIREIVRRIQARDIPDDWFIVSLYPKEREFKLEARMFSMLVLEMRVFFALTEANLADYIFPYLPQQTMTKSSAETQATFLQMTSPVTDPNLLRMYMEVDLSRWNLRWRELVMHLLGRTLNDMFGEPGIFDFVHTFFALATIIVRVKGYRPTGLEKDPPPESELLWYDHLGGFEGICQKLWSITTYAVVSLAMTGLPVSYVSKGQGDNQVMMIRLSRVPGESAETTLRRLRDLLNKRIPAEFAKVNQEVKPEECLESTSVITYSKDIYVNGVYHPTSLKSLSRLFPHSSQTFPSVRTNVGSIFSTALAGAEKCISPMLCYYAAMFHSALYLYRLSKGRGIYGSQIKQFADIYGNEFTRWIRYVLLLPSELGGFPVIPFTGFIYKGGSDTLSKSVAAMVLLSRVTNDGDQRLSNRMLSQLHDSSLFDPVPDLKNLLNDPHSIPILKPVTSADGVTHMTIAQLRDSGAVQLSEVRELMSADTDTYTETISDILAKVRPFNPSLLRDVLDCSIEGTVRTVSKMFVATRTLQAVVRSLGVPVVDKVLGLECDGLIYLAQRFDNLPKDPAPEYNIYELTNLLRARWFPDGGGSVEGMTTHLPFDFKVDLSPTGFMKKGVNAVLVADTDPYSTRGPYHPYTGSKTREKRSEHGYKIVGTDSNSQALRKLQLIVSQAGGDPGFELLIDAIAWSRTDVQMSTISGFLTGSAKGHIAHRYSSRVGGLSALALGSPNFYTHCVISTDNCDPLSGGLVDYPVMFQEHSLVALWLLQQNAAADKRGGSVTLTFDHLNILPLPDIKLVAPPGMQVPILQFRHNTLAFLPTLAIRKVSSLISHPAIPLLGTYVPSKDGCRQILEAVFRHILRTHSVGRQLADGSYMTFNPSMIDLAEVVSNGLNRISLAMAAVAADDAIQNFIATYVRGYDRWRINTYLQNVIPYLVRSVSPLLGHPLLRRDSLVMHLRLYDTPLYAKGASQPEQKLIGYVYYLARRIISGTDKRNFQRMSSVFTTKNESDASELLMSRYLSLLYYWRVNNRITDRLLKRYVRREMLSIVRAQTDEYAKVTMIGTIALQQAGELRLKHKYSLAFDLERLGQGRLVQGYKLSLEEALRSTRSSEIWGSLAVKLPKSVILKPPRIELRAYDPCKHRHKHCLAGPRLLMAQETSIDSRIRAWLYRSVGRLGLGSGSALYCWHLFSSILSKKPVLVIGVGLGAVARVALDNGCPYVMGLDLRSTLPIRSHRFRSYKPFLVESAQNNDNYHQMPESYTTTGDWFDEKVSRQVMRYDAGDYTVVIDIESSEHRYGLETLLPVIRSKVAGLIILRLFLSAEEACQLSCDLNASGFLFRVYMIDTWQLPGSYVFVISHWKDHLVYAVHPCEHHPADYQLAASRNVGLEIDADADEPRKVTRDVLAEVTFGLISGHGAVSTERAENLLCSIYLDTVSTIDTRARYENWTRLLVSILSVRFILLPQTDVLGILQTIWEDRQVDLIVGDHKSTLRVTWQIMAHLCKSASRLRIHDDPLLYLPE